MKYVKELEGVRGLMAVWVLLGHLATALPYSGYLFEHKLLNGYAVDVFIFLSGFAISSLVDKNPETYGHYITRRVFRIFPVYLLFLGISAFAANFALSVWQNAPDGAMKAMRIEIAQSSVDHFWLHLMTHIPALQSLVPDALLPKSAYAFLGQAWSVSLEWQFYIIAPFMIYALKLNYNRQIITLTIFIVLVLTVISLKMPSGFLGGSLHEFAIGILTFQFMKLRAEQSALAMKLPIGKFWLLVVVFCLSLKSVNVLPYLIWASVICAVIAVREGDSNVINRLVSHVLLSPPLQFVGRTAYSIYLSHMLVMIAGMSVLHKFAKLSTLEYSISLLAFTVIGTMFASWLSFTLVEKPFHEYGRNLFKSNDVAT